MDLAVSFVTSGMLTDTKLVCLINKLRAHNRLGGGLGVMVGLGGQGDWWGDWWGD